MFEGSSRSDKPPDSWALTQLFRVNYAFIDKWFAKYYNYVCRVIYRIFKNNSFKVHNYFLFLHWKPKQNFNGRLYQLHAHDDAHKM